MMAKRIKSAFDTITGNLGQLTPDELLELRTMIDVLLDQGEQDQEPEEPPERNGKAKRTAAGHIEAKTINGCGPYLYLRYWQGKTLKSKYIGKGKEEDGA